MPTQNMEKLQFSLRLNEVMDESPLGIPVKGSGRQMVVAKMFGVGQKAARKWMEGEGFPEMEKCIQIAKKLNVSLEWLLTGRGDKRVLDNSDLVLSQFLALWFQMSKPLQIDILHYSSFLIEKTRVSVGPTVTAEAKVKTGPTKTTH